MLTANLLNNTQTGRNREEMKGASGEGRLTLEELKEKMANFAKERDWDQFHSPRNLLLALVGEVGELSEIFQWKDICGIYLCKAVLRKLELNAIKYPISLCKGSSQKHNQLKTSPETTASAVGAAADAATSTTSNANGGA
ncbi:NTP Pyrophosphohydrolase MazG-related [Abeliophyllum distichum]|uniref:NTP Pyrophosphohydrolase MazG-related n=1 Tax=Abeliophyllum distichum TaxID=126358 RepID=A0ABD1T131_9LAMI